MTSYFEQRMEEIRGSGLVGTKQRLPRRQAAPSVGTKRGYIYFIASSRHVKIGFATSISRRLAAVQTGNHEAVRVHEAFASYWEAEKMLHERFAADRVRGEWFNLTGEIEDLWEDIWEYQGANAISPDGTGKGHLEAMPHVFFELDVVAAMLASVPQHAGDRDE